jgi:hypothetical protein
MKKRQQPLQQTLLTLLAAIFGCGATRFLNLELGIENAVVSAAIIGLIGGLVFGKYAAVNNAGAFAGMSSATILPSMATTLFVGFLVGLIWIALTGYLGFGGKQGTTGLLAVITYTLAASFFGGVIPYSTPRADLDLTAAMAIIATCGITTLLMAVFRDFVIVKVFKRDDTVLAESIISLLGGLTLPRLPLSFNTHLNLVMAEGTYAGMTSRTALTEYWDFILVGLIGGGIYLLLLPLFPGFGGKLGTMGCISNLLYQAIRRRRTEP